MEDKSKLIREARDLLVMCTLLDKSGQCSAMVERLDKAFPGEGKIFSGNRFPEAVKLIQYFVNRVESGTIRSRTTYQMYKTFLESL